MKGMTLIVKTITRWMKVFIFLYGIYITITGHLTPGGGFAGGVIIACSYILLTLAYGKEFSLQRFSKRMASELDSVGAMLFLVVALLGLGLGAGGMFFANFLQQRYPGRSFQLLSSGTIPISNIAICIKVGASLFIAFIIMSVLRIVTAEDGTKKMIQEEEEE
ncbi:MAG: MnhB domain-containing protein [bacterium]